MIYLGQDFPSNAFRLLVARILEFLQFLELVRVRYGQLGILPDLKVSVRAEEHSSVLDFQGGPQPPPKV